MKKIRKAVSLTSLWSFGLLILTSVMLYIVPAGRVAYWANWRLWGLTKTQWGELHINLGVLLLVSIVLHIYLNWNPILAYLKTKSKQMRVFTRDFNIAMVITVAVMVGTLWQVPPFSTVIAFSQAIKDAAADKYGEPPYGHAELSTVKTFVTRMGWPLEESLLRLKQKQVQVDSPDQTLLAVAQRHGLSPQQLFLVMKPAETATPGMGLPDTPPAGIGRRSLADICQAYRITIPTLIRSLSDHKISAAADQPLKAIAEQHQMTPHDLYDLIRHLADKL